MDSLLSKITGHLWIYEKINEQTKEMERSFEWKKGNIIAISFDLISEDEKIFSIDNDFIIHIGPYDLAPIGFNDDYILAKRINHIA